MSAFSTPTSLPRQWSSPAIGHKAALSATSTPLLDNIQGNDDEQERRQRRRSKVIDLHGVADCSINEAGSHRFVETQCSAPFKKKKKKESTMHKLVFIYFFSTIVLQLHQLLSQSCHRHRYLSIIQPASSFPLKMWVKIDVCWLYCIFPALCSSEMNRTITWHLPFAENYHKKCIWFAPHWLHGRHSQAEGLRAQLQGRNLSNLYLAPLQQSLHALSEIMIL